MVERQTQTDDAAHDKFPAEEVAAIEGQELRQRRSSASRRRNNLVIVVEAEPSEKERSMHIKALFEVDS